MIMNTQQSWISVWLLCFITLLGSSDAIGSPIGHGAVSSTQGQTIFAKPMDISAFDRLAVHTDGRLKSFESFVRSRFQDMTGSRLIAEQPPSFTYLDLMLRPEAYEDVPTVYVKKKPIRRQIAEALRNSSSRAPMDNFDSSMEQFTKSGLIVERYLDNPDVKFLLEGLGRDLIRSAKFVNMIGWAKHLKEPNNLRQSLRIVPPPGGTHNDRWLTIDEYLMQSHSGHELAQEGDPLQSKISQQWLDFVTAWHSADAVKVNAAATALVDLLPQVNPDVYPSQSRREWESRYFKAKNLTWIWIIYLASVIFLLLSVMYRWKTARWMGLGLFVIAFALQTLAVMLRWYVAQRWPNSNMFEAITTAAWFGGCMAIVMEIWLGRTPMRNLFALCSAVGSMTALMAAHFMPLSLSPGISNMAPILHDLWLYIHVNVIIFGYCMIFMAAISSLLYLVFRGTKLMRGGSGWQEFARVGGAGSLLVKSPNSLAGGASEKTSAGQVLDGVTMVLMELSFVMLWAGIVMGAIWADHSWGRPWGWDPKEVFALNTFLIFAILIHVRFKVRDKGLWTALLAITGCIVMLFNWIFINFFLVGLHSYA